MHITILLMAIVGIGYFFYKLANSNNDSSAMKKLLLICHGDEARVERLINRELKRAPSISFEQAINRAISSYKRDQ